MYISNFSGKVVCFDCGTTQKVKNKTVESVMFGGVTFTVSVDGKNAVCPNCNRKDSTKLFGLDYIAFANNEGSFLSNIEYHKNKLKSLSEDNSSKEKREGVERDLALEIAYYNAFKTRQNMASA